MQPDVTTRNSSLLAEDFISPKNKQERKQKRKKLQNDQDQVSDGAKDTRKALAKSKRRKSKVAGGKTLEHPSGDSFFCNLPTSSYARVVIGADSKATNLWSMEGVLAQCHIDGVLRANIHFSSLCQTQEHSGDKCCRSWSPANYVALLSNRSSCLEVTDNDLSRVKALLEQCARYYHNRQLSANCAEDLDCRRHVPTECYVDDAVYHLLHYLLDVEFIPPPNYVRSCLERILVHS